MPLPDPSSDAVPPHAARGLRVCVHGAAVTAAGLDRLRERIPAHARVALLGASAGAAWAAAEHWPECDATDPLAVLAQCAQRWPGADLVLLRADLELPPLALERLQRALDRPAVLGALPLDPSSLQLAAHADAAAIAPARLDALCFAGSARSLVDAPRFPQRLPALSAWHG
ncbi:MAG: hypothetical protein F9K31_04125, partial [Dokdonella sp.]